MGVTAQPRVLSTVNVLNYQQMVVITLYYKRGMTDAECGEAMGLSQRRVADVRNAALDIMRRAGNVTLDFLDEN